MNLTATATATATEVKNIEKENIRNLGFPHGEVLLTQEERNIRAYLLKRATTLGNLHRGKSKIVFESDTGRMEVETTIWATTEENITLKGGVTIPIRCIYEIRSY